jgi:hypothetical protein
LLEIRQKNSSAINKTISFLCCHSGSGKKAPLQTVKQKASFAVIQAKRLFCYQQNKRLTLLSFRQKSSSAISKTISFLCWQSGKKAPVQSVSNKSSYAISQAIKSPMQSNSQ